MVLSVAWHLYLVNMTSKSLINSITIFFFEIKSALVVFEFPLNEIKTLDVQNKSMIIKLSVFSVHSSESLKMQRPYHDTSNEFHDDDYIQLSYTSVCMNKQHNKEVLQVVYSLGLVLIYRKSSIGDDQ